MSSDAETAKAALELLQELLIAGSPYSSAIELGHRLDGEEWAERAAALLAANGLSTEGQQR